MRRQMCRKLEAKVTGCWNSGTSLMILSSSIDTRYLATPLSLYFLWRGGSSTLNHGLQRFAASGEFFSHAHYRLDTGSAVSFIVSTE
eukprot:scaffold1378_cov112-Skeletonema_menzelii.AAC.1